MTSTFFFLILLDKIRKFSYIITYTFEKYHQLLSNTKLTSTYTTTKEKILQLKLIIDISEIPVLPH